MIAVFLFLVSTTFAVMQYMNNEDIDKANKKLLKQNQALADPAEWKTGKIQKMVEKFNSAKTGQTAQTVVAQYDRRIRQLSNAVLGHGTSFEATMAAYDAIFKGETVQRGLVSEIKLLREKNAKQIETVSNREQKIKVSEQKIEAGKTALKELARKSEEQTTELEQQITDKTSQIEKEQAQHQAIQKESRKRTSEEIEGLNATINKLGQEKLTLVGSKQKLQSEINAKEAEIEKLKKEIELLRGTSKALPRIAGNIMGDPSNEGRCFIDIGKKDGMKPGFTFAVYPRGSITPDSKTKGSLVVIRVLDDICECRITRTTTLPIVKGDLIASLIFDAKRTYVFVVQGQFDLRGIGKASSTDTEEVKMLIKGQGGKVADTVIPTTDYVVLGKSMSQPVKPPEDAPAQVRQAYREQMEIFNRYEAVKLKAVNLRIPILNTNRFLDFVGKVPTKRLEYK